MAAPSSSRRGGNSTSENTGQISVCFAGWPEPEIVGPTGELEMLSDHVPDV
jgi:hypothetical protein